MFVLIEYVCEYCGSTFMGHKCHKRKYCSSSCFGKDLHVKYPNRKYAKRTKRTFELTVDVQAYMDGLLLGDAGIGKGTPRLKQTFVRRYLEWAEIIKMDLDDFGISSRITLYDTFDKRTNKTYELAALQTLGYVRFKDFRERWYPEGEKIVPKDLILSHHVIKNWYLGDGSCSGGKLQLATDGFDDASILYLKIKLEELGFNPWINRNRIYLSRAHEVVKFFDAIGEVPLCFLYKIESKKDLLNVVGYIPWSEEDVNILKEKYLRISSKELGKKLNKTEGAIRTKAYRLGLTRGRFK